MIVGLTPAPKERFQAGLFGAGGVGAGLGDAHAVKAPDVAGDAAVEGFGDALAVSGLAKFYGIVGIGKEGDFGEDRRHVGADQNDEGRLLDSAVFEAGIALVEPGVEAGVDVV